MDRITAIPKTGQSYDKLLDEMGGFKANDCDWRGGKAFSLVYHASDEHKAFLQEVQRIFFAENALNPMAFQSLKRMEAEVVRMSATMLSGDENTCGTMTTGGTESLLMAVKTYRDRARKKKPWITKPEMVIPATAHPAFNKAAAYFDVKLKWAPVDDYGQVDVNAMKKMVTRNTVMLAASAPQYPYGSIDPIEEIGAFAKKKKIPFHVDACFGGFVQPWLEKLGVRMPVWDFRVPGVTSISADVHKYGYAPKGASVIVYRDMSYLKHQFFALTNWCGGIYISPSMPGSRAGHAIATAWASMVSLGEDGFMELAQGCWDSAQKLRVGINGIDGLKVLGLPHSTIVSWGARDDSVDVFAVADQMQEKGWQMDRQQNPNSIHQSLSAHHAPIIDNYLDDLREAVAFVKAHPELRTKGEAAMYGMMAKMPMKGFVKQSVLKIMEGMYGPTGEVPDLSAGSGSDDPVMKLVDKYTPQALAALDKLDAIRSKIPGARR